CVSRDAFACERGLAAVEARLIRGPSRGPAPRLAVDDVRGLDHALDEDAGKIDQLRWNDTGLDDFIHFDDGNTRGLGERGIEVLAAAAELHVAETVRTVAPQQRVVDVDRVFE